MVETIPGSRRSFAGIEHELAASPDGYVFKRDSGVLHTPTCPHEPTHQVEPWEQDRVEQAWRAAPDLPVAQVIDPRFCTTCLVRWVRSPTEAEEPHSSERVEKVAAAARVVLDHLFGDGRSEIEPGATIWSAATAEHLRSAIEDFPDTNETSTWTKLRSQLDGQPREVTLLAAELLYLRSVPLLNVNAATKLERLRRVLSWLPDSPVVPASMEQGLSTGGTLNGGTGYNVQLWQQIVWLASFVKRWLQLEPDSRADLRTDPWAFRDFLAAGDHDLPSMRNTLAFLVFPDVFEQTISDGHKVAIRQAFKHLIARPSGEGAEDLDRDLLAIRQVIETQTGERISWYSEPWRSHWNPETIGTGDRAWALRPARHEGRTLIEEWLADGYISLTAAHLGDVSPGADLAVVRSAVSTGYDHQDYAQQHELANEYFAFLSRMESGDVVVARLDDDAWVGRLVGEAYYASDAPRLRRSVEWEPAQYSVVALPTPLPSLLSRTGTVLDLTEGRVVLDEMLAVPGTPDQNSAPVQTELPSEVSLPRATPDLAAQLHMPQLWLDDVITTLDERKQIILYGPPGTGKTYSARRIAKHVAGDGVKIVQFHPSYAYEDFFEGFRPRDDGDGRLSFQLREGPLRQIARAAMSDPTVPWVLIIDEINRGNIAKIFGELYFLLEYRDSSISLQYSSDKPFVLPKNLFIIGTMNTADRSIAMVDAAIRRRFAFLELHPDSEPVGGLLERWLEANVRSSERARLLRALNSELGEEHRDFQIGPSYLMRSSADTEAGLERIWRYDILPLLEEHFYGRLTPSEVGAKYGIAAIRRRVLPAPELTVVFEAVELAESSHEPEVHPRPTAQ